MSTSVIQNNPYITRDEHVAFFGVGRYNYDASDTTTYNTLIHVLREKDFAFLQTMLDRGLKINHTYTFGVESQTFTNLCINSGSSEALGFIIPQLDLPSLKDTPLLAFCVSQGHLDLFQQLMRHKDNPFLLEEKTTTFLLDIIERKDSVDYLEAVFTSPHFKKEMLHEQQWYDEFIKLSLFEMYAMKEIMRQVPLKNTEYLISYFPNEDLLLFKEELETIGNTTGLFRRGMRANYKADIFNLIDATIEKNMLSQNIGASLDNVKKAKLVKV